MEFLIECICRRFSSSFILISAPVFCFLTNYICIDYAHLMRLDLGKEMITLGKLCTSGDLDEIQNEVTLSRQVLLFYEMIEFYWTNIEKMKN